MGRITLDGYKCERCTHTWVPRDEDIPRVCPRCKSPYWDIPRGIRKKTTQSRHIMKNETMLTKRDV